jgi:hypothetical protein
MKSAKKAKKQSKKQCNTEPSTLLDQIEIDSAFKKLLSNDFVRGNVERSMKEAITGEIVTGKCNFKTNLTIDEIVNRAIKALMG